MHTVRKQILKILKEDGGATVAELAGQLEMAPVSVRHHLDLLQGDNLISVERVRRKGNVGRPQQVYSLTEQASTYFPNNFAMLAESLVRQIKVTLPPEQVQCAFHAMARELAQELSSEKLDELSTEERLGRVVDFLTQQGYLARWEKAGNSPEDGYFLHKYNCPYAGVSEEHSELCLMDQELVNQLMEQPCHRIQSLIENGTCCTYKIQDNALFSIPAKIELTADFA